MTLSDTGKSAVHWTPAATSIADIAKLAAPKKITTARSSAFQKQVWDFTTVLQSYRLASNGELVLPAVRRSDVDLHERVSAERGVPAEDHTWPGTDPCDPQRIPQSMPAGDGQLAAARCNGRRLGRRLLEFREDDGGSLEERRGAPSAVSA